MDKVREVVNMGERRFENIVRRMLDGDDFYTNRSPRISRAEIEEIETRLGVQLQKDYTFGAIPGPIAIYPVNKVEFAKKASKFLKVGESI